MRCPQCHGRMVQEQLGSRSYYSSDVLRCLQCEIMIPVELRYAWPYAQWGYA